MAYTVCFIWLKQGVQRRPSIRAVDFQVLWCIPLLVLLKARAGRGGGGNSDPHMKGVGVLVGNFELNPLKETDLGVAQAFFDP